MTGRPILRGLSGTLPKHFPPGTREKTYRAGGGWGGKGARYDTYVPACDEVFFEPQRPISESDSRASGSVGETSQSTAKVMNFGRHTFNHKNWGGTTFARPREPKAYFRFRAYTMLHDIPSVGVRNDLGVDLPATEFLVWPYAMGP